MAINIKVIMCGGAVEKELLFSVYSLLFQTFKNFRVCLILDDRGDNSAEKALPLLDERFCMVYNKTPAKSSLVNQYNAIHLLAPQAEDVLVWLDADDCLADRDVLKKVAEVYEDPSVRMTYGTYQSLSNGAIAVAPRYEPHENFRTAPWRATHLRTMRSEVFHRIPKKLVTDPRTGDFFTCATDVAVTVAALEIVGQEGYRVFSEPMVIYTDNNPLAISRLRPGEQEETVRVIQSLKK